eukprot:scaffold104674_cov34-Phaeocystis_antarctica.AAC.2
MVDELAKYYALPSVSLRDVPHLHPDPNPHPHPHPNPKQVNATFHGVTLQQLYYDRIHPSNLGHTVLALGLAHLFKHAALLAAAQPPAAATAATAATAAVAAAETAPRGCAAAPAQLLSPMDRTVDPVSTALECFAGSLLDKLVDKPRCHGWEMVVER